MVRAGRGRDEQSLGENASALWAVLTERPLISVPMAEALTGASRAAVQHNLAWMEEQGFVQEITRQERYKDLAGRELKATLEYVSFS